MDPRETLNRIVTATAIGEHEEARDAIDDLLRWVDAGGFVPDGCDVERLRALRTELTPCRKVYIPPPDRT